MSASVKEIKAKGIEHERTLVNILELKGFRAARLQSSSKSYPDIVAGDSETVFLFEVKSTTTTNVKIYKKQIHTLKNFAYSLKAKAFIALIFINREQKFIFVQPRHLKESDKMYTIDFNTACLKGKDIDEILSHELQKKLI